MNEKYYVDDVKRPKIVSVKKQFTFNECSYNYTEYKRNVYTKYVLTIEKSSYNYATVNIYKYVNCENNDVYVDKFHGNGCIGYCFVICSNKIDMLKTISHIKRYFKEHNETRFDCEWHINYDKTMEGDN